MRRHNLKFQALTNGEISGVVRKCIFSSFRVFAACQAESREPASPDWGLLHSRNFRERLSTLLADLQALASVKEGDEAFMMQIYDNLVIVERLESLWHLSEAYFLQPQNSVSCAVGRWILDSLLGVDVESMLDDWTAVDFSSDFPEFWVVVNGLVLRGMLPEAWNVIRRVSRIDAASREEIDDVRALEKVFHSHPFAEVVAGDRDLGESTDPDISVQLRKWQGDVRRVSRSLVCQRVPQLGSLLKLLSGDEKELTAACDGDWKLLTLGTFLFVQTPMLSRADVMSLVVNCMQRCPTGDLETIVKEEEERFRWMVTELLNGNVGPVLRDLYEIGSVARNGMLPDSALVAIASVAHLSELLVVAGGLEDLLDPLLDSSTSCSFVEEVCAQVAEILSDSEFPVEMICVYLKSCPSVGDAYAAAVLAKRSVTSDSNCIALAQSLMEFNDVGRAAARSVQIARGAYWLQQNSRFGMVRAFYFFQLAGDEKRSSALIERSTWAVMTMVSHCQSLFSGLTFSPPPPSFPRNRQFGASVDKPFDNLSKFLHAGDRTDDQKLIDLMEMLDAMEELLAAIRKPQTTDQRPATVLKVYIRSIRLILSALDGLAGYSGQRAPLTLLRDCHAQLSMANELLCDLVLSLTAPMSFWTHLLDLLVWLGRAAGALAEENDIFFYSTASSTNLSVCDQQCFPVSMLSRDQACGLVNALSQLESTFSKETFLSTAGDSEIASLRAELLSLATAAMVQDNANTARASGISRDSTDVGGSSRVGSIDVNGGFERNGYRMLCV